MRWVCVSTSIPARPNLPFDARGGVYQDFAWRQFGVLPCDIASRGFAGAFRAAENLTTRGGHGGRARSSSRAAALAATEAKKRLPASKRREALDLAPLSQQLRPC